MNKTANKEMRGEQVSNEQLERINLFTRSELDAKDVYVVSVILCDNEIDRDGEQFVPESLEALGELFIGKTGVFDHDPKAENQSARIFETKLIKEDTENSLGERYQYLKAWAYMLRSEKNADLIREIEAGIKKEVSVGCAVEITECSICGTDQKKAPCAHKKGEIYDGTLCYHKLINPTDAYEWSFVAVPAQKNAGVTRKGLASGPEPEFTALKEKCARLEKLAEAGREYQNGLRRDVVRLAALKNPGIKGGVIEQIAKKLEVSELQELKKAFDESEAYPMPQLFAPKSGANKNSDNDNFKI